jgi:hypothetical protein
VVPEAEPAVVAGSVATNIAKQHLRVGTYDVRFTDNAGRHFEPRVLEVTNDNLDLTIQAGPDPLAGVDVRVTDEVDPLAPFAAEIDVQNVSDDEVVDVRPVLLASAVPTGAGGISTDAPTPAVQPSLAPGEIATFTVVITPNQGGRATLNTFAPGDLSRIQRTLRHRQQHGPPRRQRPGRVLALERGGVRPR